MLHRVIATLGLGLCAFAAAASPALAGPAVSTRWQNVTISQPECLERAEQAITASGFEDLERTEQSRYGQRGDYTAAIRCIADKGIVFFIGSGPSRNRAAETTEILYNKF
jgi:hypothetical protein